MSYEPLYVSVPFHPVLNVELLLFYTFLVFIDHHCYSLMVGETGAAFVRDVLRPTAIMCDNGRDITIIYTFSSFLCLILLRETLQIVLYLGKLP